MDEVFVGTPPEWGDEVERSHADVAYEGPRIQVPAGSHPHEREYVSVWVQRNDEDRRPDGPYMTFAHTEVRLLVDVGCSGTPRSG